MPSLERRILLAGLAVLSVLGLTSAAVLAKSPKSTSLLPNSPALLASRELWATIDVCNPLDQPDTVGVRGSMPGDGHKSDKMFMSFRLQYLNAGNQWVDLASAVPAFGAVGGGAAVREGGSSFQLVPVVGKPATKLRGVVSFQWRRGGKVMLSAARPTNGGHQSVTGADPAGFSAPTCLIG